MTNMVIECKAVKPFTGAQFLAWLTEKSCVSYWDGRIGNDYLMFM